MGSEHVRLSGETPAEEVTKATSAANDELVSTEDDPTHTPRRSRFQTTGLSRMRFDWRNEDRIAIERARAMVNDRILENFRDAYEIMYELFSIVREPVTNPSTGEIKLADDGYPEWKRTSSGGYVEDFNKLTRKERENFLFQITTRIFRWNELATDAWGEAMFAKAQWEDQFSIHYDRPQTGTVQDRTAVGRLEARDERYFAVFVTLYSKKCDAVLDSMKRLEQRLKDSLDF